MNLRHKIVEALETIKYEQESKVKYQAILSFVRDQKVDLTQTRSGYWFNLTQMPDESVLDLYKTIVSIREEHSSIDKHEDVGGMKGV